MKKELLFSEAQQIKTYYEKNKKMPKTCNINNTIYSIYSTSYLMSDLINSNFKIKDYTPVEVRIYNTTKFSDTINEQVSKSDYLKMINNFIKYCKDNRRVPAYITTINSKIKVSFELFVFCLSKIIVYYYNHHALPNYCIFNKADIADSGGDAPIGNNCVNPYKSKHQTSKGCDGMGQNTSYFCGVSALHKVLYKFGIKRYTQNELAKIAGTTTSGTDHRGLETAVAYVSKKTGIKLSCKWYNFSELGFEKLAKMICKENQDAIIHLLYRNKYGHYEVINEINLKKQTVKVVNSLGNKCSSCYCGYVEERSFALEKQYIRGISQKSVCIITKG